MFSLALTHYNRFNMLVEALWEVLYHPLISEIVISDDASTDRSYEKLLKHFAHNPKVKIFRNKKNVDCYRNKAEAVRLCTKDWVILFDSDNFLPASYLETIERVVMGTWSSLGGGSFPKKLYCPDFASPWFDYTHLPKLGEVSRSNVARCMSLPRFTCALNTCNFFVNREEYLRVWDASVKPHTADTIYQNYRWLEGGNSIVFVPGLRYLHRIHEGSHYKLNHHKTGNFLREVEQKLRQLS